MYFSYLLQFVIPKLHTLIKFSFHEIMHSKVYLYFSRECKPPIKHRKPINFLSISYLLFSELSLSTFSFYLLKISNLLKELQYIFKAFIKFNDLLSQKNLRNVVSRNFKLLLQKSVFLERKKLFQFLIIFILAD